MSGSLSDVGATGPEPGSVLVQVLRAVVADILPAIWGGVTAGSVSRGTFGPRTLVGLTRRLLVEGLLGDAEGVHRGGHPAVKDHLGDDLGDFLLAYADVKCPGDVPLDHLGAVSQHHQRGDGAQAPSSQVDGGAVVNLAVDHLVHQQHHLRSKLHHGGGWIGVIVWAVVEHPEFGGSLFQVYLFHDYLERSVIFQVFIARHRVFLKRWLIGTQIRVIVIVFGGHGVHLVGVSPPP